MRSIPILRELSMKEPKKKKRKKKYEGAARLA